MVERLCLVALAAERGAEWYQRLLAYVADNSNVSLWLRRRRARNAVARHLLRILAMLEICDKFRLLDGLYLRTYRNELADFPTRAPLAEVRQHMATAGWSELQPKGPMG